MGDSWHTQNIQINKVIGENEKKSVSGMGDVKNMLKKKHSSFAHT